MPGEPKRDPSAFEVTTKQTALGGSWPTSSRFWGQCFRQHAAAAGFEPNAPLEREFLGLRPQDVLLQAVLGGDRQARPARSAGAVRRGASSCAAAGGLRRRGGLPRRRAHMRVKAPRSWGRRGNGRILEMG